MLKKGYIILALTCMVIMGVADLLMKKALDLGINYNALMFLVYMLVMVLLGFYCLARGHSLKIDKPILIYSLIIGLIICAGTLLSLIALKAGNASVIVPIIRMGFVITAICAFLFLKEKLTFQKGMGIFLAVVSLLLLSQ
ncbi:MAG: EamA family transporter [bacterium]|nr:EamA family transporter [bacterium]